MTSKEITGSSQGWLRKDLTSKGRRAHCYGWMALARVMKMKEEAGV